MKKLFTTVTAFALLLSVSQAQNVGIGTNTPDASALLHLNSTTKGVLIPSMTGSQRIALANPAEGLLVYDLTQKKTFQYQDGTWRLLLTNDYWAHSGSRNWVYNGTDSIGMGTAAPTERLHVNNGNIRLSGDLKMLGAAGIGVLAPEQSLHVRSTTSSEGILLEGSNPILQLRQTNAPAAGYSNTGFVQITGDNLRIGTNSGNSTGRFIVRNNGSDRLSVDASGNVNITGTLTSNATGPAPLTPLCYGITADINSGGVAYGTSNVTVTRFGVGKYKIHCAGLNPNSLVIVSGVAINVNVGAYYSSPGVYDVFTRSQGTPANDIDQLFKFIVY